MRKAVIFTSEAVLLWQRGGFLYAAFAEWVDVVMCADQEYAAIQQPSINRDDQKLSEFSEQNQKWASEQKVQNSELFKEGHFEEIGRKEGSGVNYPRLKSWACSYPQPQFNASNNCLGALASTDTAYGKLTIALPRIFAAAFQSALQEKLHD